MMDEQQFIDKDPVESVVDVVAGEEGTPWERTFNP